MRILTALEQVAVWHLASSFKGDFPLRIEKGHFDHPYAFEQGGGVVAAYDASPREEDAEPVGDDNTTPDPDEPLNIGQLAWRPGGKVHVLSTHPDYRRQGIATEMWNAAKKIEPNLHHSETRSDDGDAFAHSVGGYIPPRSMPEEG